MTETKEKEIFPSLPAGPQPAGNAEEESKGEEKRVENTNSLLMET